MGTTPALRDGETVSAYLGRVAEFYRGHLSTVADALARVHEDRGQIDHTVEFWSMLSGQRSHLLDSMRVQAMLKSPHIDHDRMLEGQREWAKAHAIALPDDDYIRFTPYFGDRRIRVAYACCWFDSSTIRGQGIPFIAAHDRYKLSIVAYSLGPCDRSITKHFDEFYDVGALSDVEFAKKVRNDQIDILMEFTGFSPHHRYGAMGARCAPVQISYLNHAGTSAVSNVDYVLADDIAAPRRIDPFFTEQVYRLPSTFFCFNYDWDEFPEVENPPHLKNGYITFGCFGSQSKLNDAIIKIWADVLHAVPDSRLFLRNMGLNSRENRQFMEQRFARWGISSRRLRLSPGGTREEIKANYNEVDISLDTWPYCGGNTIAESQWMGVPVVTLKGDRFPAAYGASLLHASGCDDLIAETTQGFVDVCARLAADSRKIVYYRKNLRRMMVEHGFGDAQRFARELESAYEVMLRRAFNQSPGGVRA
jgi:protein O-GlcNAc transferase